MKSNEHINHRPVRSTWLHDHGTRFGGYGELSRRQSGKRSGFRYCRECKPPRFSKGLTLPTLSSRQTSSVRIVAVAYHSAASTNLDHLITKPERLMAMLIHRDTVPPAYRVT
jgi:hypothetical protein